MTAGQGLFGGLALLAAAVLAVGLAGRVQAQATGPWQISAAAGQSSSEAWKVDTVTGATEHCGFTLLKQGSPVVLACIKIQEN